MLTIRLQRLGKKKFPTYRLVVSEKARDTQDRYTEQLGTFNPHSKENQFLPKADRILYWLSQGATTSDTVHNLLVNAGVIKGDKKRSVFLSKKRKTKVEAKNVASKAKQEEKKAAALAAEAQRAQEAEKAAADKVAADLAADVSAKALAAEEAVAKEAASAQEDPKTETLPPVEVPAQG